MQPMICDQNYVFQKCQEALLVLTKPWTYDKQFLPLPTNTLTGKHHAALNLWSVAWFLTLCESMKPDRHIQSAHMGRLPITEWFLSFLRPELLCNHREGWIRWLDSSVGLSTGPVSQSVFSVVGCNLWLFQTSLSLIFVHSVVSSHKTKEGRNYSAIAIVQCTWLSDTGIRLHSVLCGYCSLQVQTLLHSF